MILVAGTLLAFAVLWLVGSAVSSALGVSRRGATFLFTGIAVGQVLLAATGMGVIALGGRVSLPLMYAVLSVLGLLAFAGGGRPRIPPVHWPGDAIARVIAAGTLIALVVLGLGALRDRLLWDAWAFWTLKAKAILSHGRLPPEMLTLVGPYPWTHPEYPLGLPLFDWWVFAHVGGAAPAAASFAGIIWLSVLTLLLWQGLREVAGERSAAGAALGVVVFWPITSLAAGGYAEILIAIALLAVVIELAAGLGPKGEGSPARLALFLSFAIVAKNEGQALAAVVVATAVYVLWSDGSRRLRDYVVLLIPAAVIAPWLAYTRFLGVSAEHVGDVPDFPVLLERLPFLFQTFTDLAFTRAWTPLPFLVLAGLVARKLNGSDEAGAAWMVIAGYFLVTQIVLLVTPLDLEWLVINSYFRIVGVLVPALVYLSLREIGRVNSRMERHRGRSGLLPRVGPRVPVAAVPER